jgi:hypothetical protein
MLASSINLSVTSRKYSRCDTSEIYRYDGVLSYRIIAVLADIDPRLLEKFRKTAGTPQVAAPVSRQSRRDGTVVT